jgi:hypothetical protein
MRKRIRRGHPAGKRRVSAGCHSPGENHLRFRENHHGRRENDHEPRENHHERRENHHERRENHHERRENDHEPGENDHEFGKKDLFLRFFVSALKSPRRMPMKKAGRGV